MSSKKLLQARLTELTLDLNRHEKNFNSLRVELKLSKKQITDIRGAITEVEKLLLSPYD